MIKKLLKNYSKYIQIGFAALVFIMFIVFLSHYISTRNTDSFIEKVRNEWKLKNQEIYDNMAIIRNDLKNLDINYNRNKDSIKKQSDLERKRYDDIKKQPKKQEIASYFDNIIDENKR